MIYLVEFPVYTVSTFTNNLVLYYPMDGDASALLLNQGSWGSTHDLEYVNLGTGGTCCIIHADGAWINSTSVEMGTNTINTKFFQSKTTVQFPTHFPNGMTHCMWVYFDSWTGTGNTFLSWGTEEKDQEISFRRATETMFFLLYGLGSSILDTPWLTNTLYTWTHICLVFPITATDYTIYVNGANVGTGPKTTTSDKNRRLRLGISVWEDQSEIFRGRYDEIRVYDKLLSNTEILQVYDRTGVSCDSGTYLQSPENSCIPCPAGTFSTLSGAVSASTCTVCEAGTYSSDIGATLASNCQKCIAGNVMFDIGRRPINDIKNYIVFFFLQEHFQQLQEQHQWPHVRIVLLESTAPALL